MLRTSMQNPNKLQESSSDAAPYRVEIGSAVVANEAAKQQAPLLFCRSLSMLAIHPVSPATVSQLSARQPIYSQVGASVGGTNQSMRARSSSLATSQFWVRQRKNVTDVLKGTSIGMHRGLFCSPENDATKQKQSDRKTLQNLVKDFYSKQKQKENAITPEQPTKSYRANPPVLTAKNPGLPVFWTTRNHDRTLSQPNLDTVRAPSR